MGISKNDLDIQAWDEFLDQMFYNEEYFRNFDKGSEDYCKHLFWSMHDNNNSVKKNEAGLANLEQMSESLR
jgi:hypothetical protein